MTASCLFGPFWYPPRLSRSSQYVLPDFPVTTPIRRFLGQEKTSDGNNTKGDVPRSLSAPSSCVFSQGMKKSMIVSVPFALILALTAASSNEEGGLRPGMELPVDLSCAAYPLPVEKYILPAPSDARPPPLIQMPPPLTEFGSGPPSVANASTICPVVL
jgi:hypothetical protein